MSKLLVFVFIFFLGSTFGWVLELFFRRIVHKKWVNPGFLTGPYLPIYGFGLCVLTYSYMLFTNLSLNPILVILLMGLFMTIIELIGGLCFIYGGYVKLWDYSNQWGNYKGIICPLFSLIWTVLGGVYYYFIASYVLRALDWFSCNLSFSFILGIFVGLICIDFINSTKLLVKIRKFAKENDVKVKYEEFISYIKDLPEKGKKYFFTRPLKRIASIKESLEEYVKNH